MTNLKLEAEEEALGPLKLADFTTTFHQKPDDDKGFPQVIMESLA